MPGTSGPESLRRASGSRARRPSTGSLGARCLPALKSTSLLLLRLSDSFAVSIQDMGEREDE